MILFLLILVLTAAQEHHYNETNCDKAKILNYSLPAPTDCIRSHVSSHQSGIEEPAINLEFANHNREGQSNIASFASRSFRQFRNNRSYGHIAASTAFTHHTYTGDTSNPFRSFKKNKAVKVILDSDIGQDCDDAAVMALMHKFADNGEVEILATMFPMQDPMGAPAMDVINTYYGRPDIPIGTYKGNFQYLGKLHDHYNTKLATNFPHDLKHGNEAPDAIALYRKILAKQRDKSVVIVAVGPERLLADLLKTGPDTYSKLSGRELVKKKVKLLSLMGAGFPKDQEWNIKIAPDAAKLVAETWPTPVVYSGNEIGKAIRTGSRLLTETPQDNPVRASFENHPFVNKVNKDRESWDQTAMLFAIKGPLDLWTVESNGYNFIDDTGKNEWRRDTDKDHSYLILKKPATEIQKIIEDLMVAPPAIQKR